MSDNIIPSLETCFFFKNNKKDVLIIAFSSFDIARKHNGKFDFFFLTKWTDIDVLLVRDPENTWYQEPIAGYQASSEAMFSHIANFAQNYKKIICIGASMGGYGAIFFGHRLKNTEVLAFNPQICLNGKKLQNLVHFSKELRYSYEISPRKVDTNIAKINSSAQRINIFIGTQDIYDFFYSKYIKRNKNFNLIYLKDFGHYGIRILHKFSFLEKIIKDAIYDKPIHDIHNKIKFIKKVLDHDIIIKVSNEVDSLSVDLDISIKIKNESLLTLHNTSYDIIFIRFSDKKDLTLEHKNFQEEVPISSTINFDLNPYTDGVYLFSIQLFYKNISLADAGFPPLYIFLEKREQRLYILGKSYKRKRYTAYRTKNEHIAFRKWPYNSLLKITRFLFLFFPNKLRSDASWPFNVLTKFYY